MLVVNLSDVLAELSTAFADYERALIADDIATLNELFLDSPLTVRYGARASELQHSYQEIAEFRLKRGPVYTPRSIRNTRITTFGHHFGVANTEFVLENSGAIGRQSQTWIRTLNGWKIVSAHVSFGQ